MTTVEKDANKAFNNAVELFVSERFSPSRFSLDSGFESGPCSPDSASVSSSAPSHATDEALPQEPQPSSSPVSTDTKKRVSLSSEPCTSAESESSQDAHWNRLWTARFECRWEECGASYSDVNDFFDHAMQSHVEVLAGKTKSSARRGSDDDRFQCKWHGCEMTLKRGTPQKKFEWLCGHFRARHAPKAQPLRCLISECTTRFSNQKALIAHLRNSHDDDKPGRKATQPPPSAQSCYGYQPRVRSEKYGRLDFMDRRTYKVVAERLLAQLQAEEDEPKKQRKPSDKQQLAKSVAILGELFPAKFGKRRV